VDGARFVLWRCRLRARGRNLAIVMDRPPYRRMLFRRFGPPEVFEWEAQQPRTLAAGEVLIGVRFIGVNFADIIARRGYYKWAGRPPICPGFEVSGEVMAVGPGVRISVGTPVAALTKFGGYTEALIVPETQVFPLPAGMTLEQAAAFPAVYITAYQSLVEVMRIRAGDDILIQAVAGGVGIAALQIAKHYGVTTYGTASSDTKLDYARAFGLDHGINYVREDFEAVLKRLTAGRGVKFVLDSLGGYGLRKGIRCLKRGGHAVTIGAAAIVPPARFHLREWGRIIGDLLRGGVYHPFYFIELNRGLSGVQILLFWDQAPYLRAIVERLLDMYTAGGIKPPVSEIFPLAQVGDAHRLIESRRSQGKVLLSA
jgi:NADPH:quinone reductase-like Zn-dependent oxidoreductase